MKKYIKKYVALCYDICHFSVLYENQHDIINCILNDKLKVGKVQISAALELFLDKEKLPEIKKKIFFLIKSNFLHQNSLINNKNKVIKKNDFSYDLISKNPFSKIRIHCHMPLYLTKYNEYVHTTSEESVEIFLEILKKLKIKHFEIETYTYDLLSSDNKFISMVSEYSLIVDFIKNV